MNEMFSKYPAVNGRIRKDDSFDYVRLVIDISDEELERLPDNFHKSGEYCVCFDEDSGEMKWVKSRGKCNVLEWDMMEMLHRDFGGEFIFICQLAFEEDRLVISREQGRLF